MESVYFAGDREDWIHILVKLLRYRTLERKMDGNGELLLPIQNITLAQNILADNRSHS